ncbi:MAG: DNA-3-methyladenine glycosylase 2 family protein, partial [Planctomycetes bacterium]|nr:DNA-3-methyladenine glycosylase 2 family protein [Planctomycetota bacterium]
MTKLAFDWDDAVAHVSRRDKRIGRVIRNAGDIRLEITPYRSPFLYLMRAIIYQQLSGKAAGTIHGRVIDLFPTKRQVTPERLLKLKNEQLRGAGVSGGKTKALRDLARKAAAGEVPGFAKLRRMDDEEVIECLTAIHGIGRWTVEMLLMFQLGRPDVLPIHDLGVRKGFALAHKLKEMPTPKELESLADKWRPFRSVGSWY